MGSSFSTLQCIPSGTWDLCMSKWVMWYWTFFFCYTHLSFCYWCTHFSFWFSHFLLVIPVSADLWLSWLCSYMHRLCFCTAVSTLCPTHFSSSQLRQDLHAHLCWPSAMLACFLSCTVERTFPLLWGDCPWKSDSSPASICPLEAASHGMLPSRSLKRLKFAFLKSRVVILLSVLLISLKLYSNGVTTDCILRILWLKIYIIKLAVAKSYSCESIIDNVN